MFTSQKSPSEAAEELCNLAIRLGTSDNVTVVIAQFVHI
jgi:serine/threonine protein phosphatase PrpC